MTRRALIADGVEMALCGSAALEPSRTKRLATKVQPCSCARVIRWRCICARTSLSMPFGWPGRCSKSSDCAPAGEGPRPRRQDVRSPASEFAPAVRPRPRRRRRQFALQAVERRLDGLRGPPLNSRRASGCGKRDDDEAQQFAERAANAKSVAATRHRRGSRPNRRLSLRRPGANSARTTVRTARADALEGSLDHQDARRRSRTGCG